MAADDILIFGGSGSPELTARIAHYLGVSPGLGETLRFSEGNLFVRILRERSGAADLPRAVHRLSCQRQLYGTALLDRRLQTRER